MVVKHFDENGNIDFTATYITGEDGLYSIAIPKGGEQYRVEITKPIEVSGEVVDMTFVQTSNVGAISGKGTELFDSEKDHYRNHRYNDRQWTQKTVVQSG